MPDKHSMLGPSAAHRWLLCTPSARLCEGIPETPSPYAEKGRLAHEIAELKLKKYSTPMPVRSYNAALNKLKKNAIYEEEMDKNTDIYLEFIKSLALAYSSSPLISVEKEVHYEEYAPDGFGTADCILIGDNIIHVIDYKNGSGVPVSPTENVQMKLYALGAYLMYQAIYGGLVDTVRMSIVQPNTSGDACETWETPLTDLMGWTETIRTPAQLAHKGEGSFAPGEKQCRFCKAKNLCRARKDYNLASEEFMPMIPPLITDAEVGEILSRTRDLAKYVKDLEAYALRRSLEGVEIPGWKAVEGRANRTFSDIDAAFTHLTTLGYAENLFYERKPITLTAVEAIIGKKEFKEKLADFVIVPPGKPTLAEAKDKRPAVTSGTSAAQDFAEPGEE